MRAARRAERPHSRMPHPGHGAAASPAQHAEKIGASMLHVDQKVMYGCYGVCRVAQVDARMEGTEGRRYYILEPGSQRKGRVFLPMDHEELVRPLLSREEVLSLIDSSNSIEIDAFRDNNQRLVEEHFKKLLKTKDQACAIQVAKTMHAHIKEQTDRGASPSATYMRLLEQAESQVEGEFSEVLGISCEEVHALIAERMRNPQGENENSGPQAKPVRTAAPITHAAEKLRHLFR